MITRIRKHQRSASEAGKKKGRRQTASVQEKKKQERRNYMITLEQVENEAEVFKECYHGQDNTSTPLGLIFGP